MAPSTSIAAPILAPPPRPAMYSTHEETYEDTPEPAPATLNPFLQQSEISDTSMLLEQKLKWLKRGSW